MVLYNHTWDVASSIDIYDLSTTEPPYNVPRKANFVLSGIIIHAGIIFNTLSFIVLVSSSTLRQTSSGLYLTSLSVADTLCLIGELLIWMNDGHKPFDIDITFMNRSSFACKFIYFLRYGGKITSAWLTVAITTERLVLVKYPMQHVLMSTKRTTYLVIIITFALSFILGSFPWWSVQILIKNYELGCGVSDQMWYEIGSWVGLRVGSLMLPGIIVGVMTAIIIYHMTHAQHRRTRTLCSRHPMQRQNTREARKMVLEKQLTMMLIAVAVAFILLRLPYSIMYYVNRYKDNLWDSTSKLFDYHIYAANTITNTIAISNYAVNFFLYYVCGGVFRNQLKLLCACAVCGSRGISRQRSTSSVPMTAVSQFTRSRIHSNRSNHHIILPK